MRILLGAGALVASLALSSCGGPTVRVTEGEPARPFSLETSSGGELALSDIGGPVVLAFWSTTCAPCLAEVPQLNQLHERGDVSVIGITLDQDGVDRVVATASRVGIGYPILLDGSELFASYGGVGLPHTVFIDAAGTVRRIVRGKLERDELLTLVDEMEGPR